MSDPISSSAIDPMPNTIKQAKARLKVLGFTASGPQIVFNTTTGKVAVSLDTRSPENDSWSRDSIKQQLRLETVRAATPVKVLGPDLHRGMQLLLLLIQHACPERGWGAPAGVTDQPEDLAGWQERMASAKPDTALWMVDRFTVWTTENAGSLTANG
jgi:hypothetical protein